MDEKVSAEIFEKLNIVLGDGPLFFIAPEAERGLGLEDKLTNYLIVATKADSVGQSVVAANRGAIFAGVGSTANLAESKEFLDYIKSKTQGFLSNNKKCFIQYFKPTEVAIAEKIATEGYSVKVLNNSPELTRELENKIKQYQMLAEAGMGIYLPESEVKVLKEVDLQKLAVDPEQDYVVQLPFGHTGLSTYFLQESDQDNTLKQLLEIQAQYPNRIAKVAKEIKGNCFTISACLYKDKVYIGGLSYQYTGIRDLTRIPAATVGNDWELPQQLLTSEQKSELIKITRQIGELLMLTKGFKGMFGVDFIVEESTGKIFVLEINPRQVASISMHSKLQIERGQVPLAALHLAEFLGVDIDLDPLNYCDVCTAAMPAAQVFLRSMKKDDYAFPQLTVKSGVYRQQSDNTARELIANNQSENVFFLDASEDRPLIWQKEGKSLSDFNEEGFLLLLKQTAEKISYNEELARIQLRRSAAQLSGNVVNLIPLVSDTFKRLRALIEE